MQPNDLEIIFTRYKDKFFKYLVPWIVNDLRKNDVPPYLSVMISQYGNDEYYPATNARLIFKHADSQSSSQSHSLDKDLIEIIKYSIERYFKYLFPIIVKPSSINIETFRNNTLLNIQQYVREHNLYNKIFNYVKNDIVLDNVFDDEENDYIYGSYERKVNKLKGKIAKEINAIVAKIKPKIDLDRLKRCIDDNMEHLISVEFKNYDTGRHPFASLNYIKELNIDDEAILRKGYKYYVDKYYEAHPNLKDETKPKPKPKPKPKTKTKPKLSVKAYIDKIVSEEDVKKERPKSKDEIKAIIIDAIKALIINIHNLTIDEIYDYYIQKRSEKYNIETFKLEPFTTNKSGYKRKYSTDIPNYFPLKSNIKKYSLHTISPRYSYIIDLMFENRKYCYLVAININTRKLWVECTNLIKINLKKNDNETDEDFKERLEKAYEAKITKEMKSTENYLKALQTMMNKGMVVKNLKGDGEKTFISNDAKTFYKNHGINFITVRRQITKYPDFMQDLNMVKKLKDEPYHSSLGIIDRVIRTIRDIAFNLNVREIDPSVMEYIVNLYNNHTHTTLSKYAGIKVSPNDVNNNPE